MPIDTRQMGCTRCGATFTEQGGHVEEHKCIDVAVSIHAPELKPEKIEKLVQDTRRAAISTARGPGAPRKASRAYKLQLAKEFQDAGYTLTQITDAVNAATGCAHYSDYYAKMIYPRQAR
jgi:hypothetical protein